MQPLLSAADVEDCVEAHIARHTPSGKTLYLTIIGLVIAGAASTPFIQVPIVVQADGIVRPSVERQDARAPESGIVRSVRVMDGSQVNAGDTLITLDVEGVRTRLALLDSIAQAQSDDLADLEALLAAQGTTFAHVGVRTAHRRQQLSEHLAIEANLVARAAVEAREAARLRELHSRGFATAEQTEQQDAAQYEATAAVRGHHDRARTQWSADHADLTVDRHRTEAERSSLVEMLARFVVVAPVAGTVELTVTLSPGSVLERGERVATISPNTDLVAETLLAPRDIGLVRPGTPVRLMVDAFNYRDWGVLDAVVRDISDDASLDGDSPMFRVRCRLTQTELSLGGGQRASLKKGMTFRARFLVADRSLLQLLFDDVDDWLNPGRTKTAAT